MRRRVLFVAYYFPPIGGAGTQRSLKFVRHLPSFGFDLTVLTGPGITGGRWTPVDESFNEEIPREVRVIRTSEAVPKPADWTQRMRRVCFLRSSWDQWWIDQVHAAAREQSVDVICGTGPPYATLEAIAAVARERKIPWIADLRDLWALDEMAVYATTLHRRREERRMARTLATAAAIVTTSPAATTALELHHPELASRTVTITNGFDAADFARRPAREDRHRFRIVHTGYLHTEAGLRQKRLAKRLLGGGARDIEILTRSHIYLLRAIAQLLNQDPSLAQKLEVCLAGVLSAPDQEVAGQSPVTRVLGYLPHGESIDLLRSADLLFLPMQNTPPGHRSTTIPGKTFEYLAAERPILAAVPPGDAHDLLVAAGADVCAPDDAAGMARAIKRHLDHGGASSQGEARAPDVLEPFERARLAAALAETLDEVLTADRSPRRVA